MAQLLPEILEKILIRLDVRDLIRCKTVSKSWLSLISDPCFIKAHLDHRYHSDRSNDEIAHRRMVICQFSSIFMLQPLEINYLLCDHQECPLLGTSNGLVCVSPTRTEILVINPSTREVKKLTNPQVPEIGFLCWGFGYDSSTDDYKIVLGQRKGDNCTLFRVFSLRSNIWKDIGEVNYAFISRIGVLCKGALHWVAYSSSETGKKIYAFHLSKERFAEVPQPDHSSYQSHGNKHSRLRLGTMGDCLCLFRRVEERLFKHDLWVMKAYNVKNSWEIVEQESESKHDVVHYLKRLKHYIPNKRPLCHEKPSMHQSPTFVGAPIYVESLVSPHFHKRLKRKKRATNTVKSAKVKPNSNVDADASTSASGSSLPRA